MLRSKFRRPWQPRMRDGAMFNPFAHTTEPEASLAEHHDIELEELEATTTEPEASLAEHHDIEQLDEFEATAERSQTGKPTDRAG